MDTAQQLLFGVFRMYRITVDGRFHCLQEQIFYADSLESERPDEFRLIRDYCRAGREDVDNKQPRLQAISREQFARQMITVLRMRGLVVAFNLPFDLSRVACGCGRARKWHPRAFSFWFGEHRGSEDKYLPRIAMSMIDSKRAFYKIRGSRKSKETAWRGALLDLRTLAFALSGKSLSLGSAGEFFGARERKQQAPEFGRITKAAIDYCRADVRATASLLEALKEEFDLHPIELLPWRTYSPASIGKAYLRAGRIQL